MNVILLVIMLITWYLVMQTLPQVTDPIVRQNYRVILQPRKPILNAKAVYHQTFVVPIKAPTFTVVKNVTCEHGASRPTRKARKQDKKSKEYIKDPYYCHKSLMFGVRNLHNSLCDKFAKLIQDFHAQL